MGYPAQDETDMAVAHLPYRKQVFLPRRTGIELLSLEASQFQQGKGADYQQKRKRECKKFYQIIRFYVYSISCFAPNHQEHRNIEMQLTKQDKIPELSLQTIIFEQVQFHQFFRKNYSLDWRIKIRNKNQLTKFFLTSSIITSINYCSHATKDRELQAYL